MEISYYPLPSGLFRDNLQHWLGDFARVLNMQFISNEGMSRDAPIHECESEIDHYTGHYVPYSLWRVCGFFNIPKIYYMCRGLWDGAYGLSSLSEKTRKSNRLQMLLQTALSPQLFKDPAFWSCWGLNLRPPAQPTGAYPIELTGWWLT